jgi:hypothetical protein
MQPKRIEILRMAIALAHFQTESPSLRGSVRKSGEGYRKYRPEMRAFAKEIAIGRHGQNLFGMQPYTGRSWPFFRISFCYRQQFANPADAGENRRDGAPALGLERCRTGRKNAEGRREPG